MAAWSLLATSGFFAVGAYAQTAPTTPATPEKKTDAQVLEKFVVTGSYLPPAANAVATPVIAVDAKAIENSGNNTNVLEILRKTVPQFSGNSNIGSANANVGSGSTNGGSQVALRNTTTLVLINGRRAAYTPDSATGPTQFVDVNLIPVAAIERIEILADGASAIYGTDAVGGVVNIIMKTNYEGFEAGGRYGWSTNKGHAADRSGYVVGGVSNGKTSMTLSAEYLKQDPIFNYERPYSDPTYGTATFAGSVNAGTSYYYLDPAKQTPTVTAGGLPAATLVSNGTYSGPRAAGDQFQFFNLAQYVTQTIQNERKSMSLAADHTFWDNFKMFTDVLYAQTNTYSQINGQPITASIAPGVHGNPFNVTVTARNRLTSHPRQYLDDTTSIRGVVGASGKISEDWGFEVAATYNRVTQDYSNPGVISQAHLTDAINNDRFNMFSRIHDEAEVAADGIVGTATGGFISTLRNLDATVHGKLFDLPAGPLDVAFRAEQRREALSATADPNSQIDPVTGLLGWNGATTLYPFDSNRTVGALAGEVRIPLVKDVPGAHLLELSGAVRHEFYSDTENPTVPKISARYLPFNDEFALRGSYGKSFSAPTLFSLFGPVSIGFTDPFTLNKSGGGKIDNLQTNSESGSNPKLKPSRAENYTVGFIYSPKAIKGLSFTVDYYHIRQTDLISTIGTTTILQDVETNGPSSIYAGSVHLNSFTGPGVTAKGQIGTGVPDNIYVVDTYVNISKQELSGFDISGKYTYAPEGIGRFDFSSAIGIYNKFNHINIPGNPAEETVGKSTDYNGTIPRWQSYTTVDFTRDSYNAVLGWRSIPAVTDDDDGTRVGSFNTIDLSFSYTFGATNKWLQGAKFTVGANNVFNRYGPKDPTIFSDSNVDTSTYGAYGRFVYFDVRYKF